MVVLASILVGCLVAAGLHLLTRAGSGGRLIGAGLIGLAVSLFVGSVGRPTSGDPLPPVLGLLVALVWAGVIGVIHAAGRPDLPAPSPPPEGPA